MSPHVVRELAGHSDIKTPQTYYLSVQEDDLAKAREVQSAILELDPTDQLMINSAPDGRSRSGEEKGPDS